ncbi:hypothetical protein KIN20_018257 [Parelaphostrongylus tenuis]|uniref:Uncharacterized protein n=1 Tax=Parelaphostrongylus tenuis TaxID=148309 RepID=A0AAD5QS19_PARTN|nr:hypothetical protein KIN20_018257 [Parelaphostrongylus tenuis]
MQTVIDVLEIEGRRALLPDFVISNILGQLQVNTTYEPLLCENIKLPGENQDMMKNSCIIVGSTVTGFAQRMRMGIWNVRSLQQLSTTNTCRSRNSHDYEHHHG